MLQCEKLFDIKHQETIDKLTLDQLLNDWSVLPPGMWENSDGPDGWFAVCNTEGIIAYFGNERDAYRFRLAEINRILNS